MNDKEKREAFESIKNKCNEIKEFQREHDARFGLSIRRVWPYAIFKEYWKSREEQKSLRKELWGIAEKFYTS
ncbi:hypothetical protein ACFLX2_01480 [Candidatus Dependentiae bacterium]